MATVRLTEEKRTLRDVAEITGYLAGVGIDYEHWEANAPLSADAAADEILAAYAPRIEQIKARGGYVLVDVIEVKPETPGLEAMLAKFSVEHWHDEDEVRYIVAGRGLFHIHPRDSQVIAIEVEAGDLIRVPRGTWHWFDVCGDRRIRTIRFFQEMAGWTPHYTASGVDKNHQPVCLGPAYFPPPPPRAGARG
jgi:1,2-dihydroxy-3-keto-5-methylthiopentene dioxygenase